MRGPYLLLVGKRTVPPKFPARGNNAAQPPHKSAQRFYFYFTATTGQGALMITYWAVEPMRIFSTRLRRFTPTMA